MVVSGNSCACGASYRGSDDDSAHCGVGSMGPGEDTVFVVGCSGLLSDLLHSKFGYQRAMLTDTSQIGHVARQPAPVRDRTWACGPRRCRLVSSAAPSNGRSADQALAHT